MTPADPLGAPGVLVRVQKVTGTHWREEVPPSRVYPKTPSGRTFKLFRQKRRLVVVLDPPPDITMSATVERWLPRDVIFIKQAPTSAWLWDNPKVGYSKGHAFNGHGREVTWDSLEQKLKQVVEAAVLKLEGVEP